MLESRLLKWEPVMKGHRTALAALPAILVALGSAPAGASGIATHMFHAEIGAANVEDPDLRAILAANREAWISAASFPDGGYPVDYVWAEPAHWAPFANAYTEQVKSVCQGRYTTDAYCEKLVAHLMGAVGHGFEDQVVDALLGPKILEVDGDDSNADFYIDLFVLHDFDRDDHLAPRRPQDREGAPRARQADAVDRRDDVAFGEAEAREGGARADPAEPVAGDRPVLEAPEVDGRPGSGRPAGGAQFLRPGHERRRRNLIPAGPLVVPVPLV